MMFILLLVLSVSASRTLFQDSPADTFAIIGQNVTLRCTLKYKDYIAMNNYNLVWLYSRVEPSSSIHLIIRSSRLNRVGRYTISSWSDVDSTYHEQSDERPWLLQLLCLQSQVDQTETRAFRSSKSQHRFNL